MKKISDKFTLHNGVKIPGLGATLDRVKGYGEALAEDGKPE